MISHSHQVNAQIYVLRFNILNFSVSPKFILDLFSKLRWCPMPPSGLFLLFLSITQRKKRNCSRFPPFSPCTQYTTESTPKRASRVSCGQHTTGVLFPVLTLRPELCKGLRLCADSFHPIPSPSTLAQWWSYLSLVWEPWKFRNDLPSLLGKTETS